MLLQYPDTFGKIDDLQHLPDQIHSAGAHVVVASDLLALTLLKPPGEWGADIVVGSSQVLSAAKHWPSVHLSFSVLECRLDSEVHTPPSLRVVKRLCEKHPVGSLE